MKKGILTLALAVVLGGAGVLQAVPTVNLTPAPKEITVGEGALTLPESFSIAAAGLPADMTAEISKFAAALKGATGIDAASGSTLFTVSLNGDIAPEGYTLVVAADGVKIEASTAAGLYYAFQTVKKVLPPNVMAGVAAPGPYALPLMTINDEPRYPWRGMELDCARHFFELDQLKKMVDVMATYKLNRLHWHLTDDQGWRLEMAKYPLLTTADAAPLNNYWCDFDTRHSYILNEPYGPYYYTIDEMKELVAYAKERHIEVCPEVDMPGHMQAAIAAYPEFSTTPNSSHPVRYWPGVSTDVLDISNPAVVRFTKDIIDQLVEIFPYEYIHIGGDECPTSAWANSPACQQFKKDYGLKSDRAIQNWLTKELADYAKAHDRKLICWNEVLTTEGADKQMVKDADILIYAWLNAGADNNPSKQAAALGLRSVWCSTHHYYLDYPQWGSGNEPLAMGHVINLETVYKATPDYESSAKKAPLYYGVNCNLWTEYVCENKHLEYNALPRMIAVAETGWTPQANKNWEEFLERFNADTAYLDLAGYTYGRHYVTGAASGKEMPQEGKYYRLITRATNQGRLDRCIELVGEGSPLIAEFGAKVGSLWTNAQAAEGDSNYDRQYWRFEADPEGSGKYALVCRADESGSLNPQMEGSLTGARWVYSSEKNYNFILGDYYGDYQDQHTYSIRSGLGADAYLSAATSGDKLSVNNWARPDDGDGGIWFFSMENYTAPVESHPAFTPLQAGVMTNGGELPEGQAFVDFAAASNWYVIENALTAGQEINFIAQSEDDLKVTNAANASWGNVFWILEDEVYDPVSNVQTFKMRNPVTGAYIGRPSATPLTSATDASGSFAAYRDNLGYLVGLTSDKSAAADVRLYLADESADNQEYVLEIEGKRLLALPAGSEMHPESITAMANAVRRQGATWRIARVEPALYRSSLEGSDMKWWKQTLKHEETISSPIEDYKVVSCTAADDGTYLLELARESWTVTYDCVDAKGQMWATVVEKMPVGVEYTPAVPAVPGLKNGRFAEAQPAFVPDADKTLQVIYETEAWPGVAAVGRKVDELETDKYYLIRDAHEQRNAFRCDASGIVSGAKSANGVGASFVWVLEANGSNYNIKNVGSGLYVQAVSKSANTKLGAKPYAFTITRRTDVDAWTIKNSKNALVWDGNENMMMVGWDAPGHPIEFYEFTADPMFSVTVEERDENDKLLASRTQYVKPGAGYRFEAVSRPGKDLVSVTGNENLENIDGNRLITVTYNTGSAGINEIDSSATAGSAKGIYDLQGHKLSRIGRPGIYIINDKKTIVR